MMVDLWILKSGIWLPQNQILQKLSTQQIGRLGELLVQYELLACGIDSAPLTTDAGIDLVGYSSIKRQSITIQVKTTLKPKPGGGKGAFALDWWVGEDCPAELYAFVDISTRRIWLFAKEELQATAQQKSGGRLHFYMYTDQSSDGTAYQRNGDALFSNFLLEKRMARFFHI